MDIHGSIALQAVLVCVASAITILRCWVRLRVEHRSLTISDYFIWVGWVCTVGWFICSVMALNLQIDHPLTEEGYTDSVDYLVTVYVSCFFFDIGLYMPKCSILAFYWWLIPRSFRRLRIALYIGTAFMASAGVASILTDLLLAIPISTNWSLENQADSVWNNFADLVVNWVLNFATDLLLFILPFFIIFSLKLRRRQKVGLFGVFGLGAITMAISLARFIVYCADYDIDDASGKLCTAVIVASLPGLKNLIFKSTTATNTSYKPSTHGYVQTGSHQPSIKETYNAKVAGGRMDDEVELVFLDRKSSPISTGTGTKDPQDGISITKDMKVTHDVL